MNKRKKKTIFGLAAVLMLLAPSEAKAQPFDATIPGTKMTLEQCFQLADKQNLTLQAGRKSIEHAKVMEGTAWDVDKTEIAFGQNPASSGDTDNALAFSQGIEFPTVYTARRGQLKAETQAEKSRLGVTNQQIKLKIASAYYAMLYQTHRLSILQRQDSILDRYCDVAEKRYKAGEARQLEFLTAERLRNENHLEMVNVKSEAENKQLELMALLNTDQPVLPAESLLIALESPVSGTFNYQQTADAQYQQDRLKALDKEVKCAKTGYAPSLSLTLRTQALISSWDPYHIDRQRFTKGNFFGFEIGVGVPLFYGATKAKVKAAKKDREVYADDCLDYFMIAKYLERIGDHARDIKEDADKIKVLGEKGQDKDLIQEFVDYVLKMYDDSVKAFVRFDFKLAEEIAAQDNEVDSKVDAILDQLIKENSEKKVSGAYVVYQTLIIKYLERIVDHAVNIAEWVVFIKNGFHKDSVII